MTGGWEGGQAEYARVAFADNNLLRIPDEGPDEKYLLLSVCAQLHQLLLIESWLSHRLCPPWFRTTLCGVNACLLHAKAHAACLDLRAQRLSCVMLQDVLATAWHASELGEVEEGDVVGVWCVRHRLCHGTQCSSLLRSQRMHINVDPLLSNKTQSWQNDGNSLSDAHTQQ